MRSLAAPATVLSTRSRRQRRRAAFQLGKPSSLLRGEELARAQGHRAGLLWVSVRLPDNSCTLRPGTSSSCVTATGRSPSTARGSGGPPCLLVLGSAACQPSHGSHESSQASVVPASVPQEADRLCLSHFPHTGPGLKVASPPHPALAQPRATTTHTDSLLVSEGTGRTTGELVHLPAPQPWDASCTRSGAHGF